MSNYKGTVIEESLKNKEILKKLHITSTRVEKVTDAHETPWISQWTLDDFEVLEQDAETTAEELSKSLDSNHGASWYVDFKNKMYHYIIFRDKVFCVDRKNKEQYDEAESYGRSLGIPAHQLINYEGEYKDAIK